MLEYIYITTLALDSYQEDASNNKMAFASRRTLVIALLALVVMCFAGTWLVIR